MNFIKRQLEKETVAVKKVWWVYLKFLAICWGVLGLVTLFSPAWPIGVVLIVSALYVHQRTKVDVEKKDSAK